MPLVTNEPRSHLNGDLLTEFVDVANTTGLTYNFKATQNFLMLRNCSQSNITLNVGTQNLIIGPWQIWDGEVDFSSFTISASKDSQQFIASTVQYDPKSFRDSPLPGGGMKVGMNQRIHLVTDERWIKDQGHLSDLIRLQWKPRTDGAGAKPALVWCNENGEDKTAIISHDLANDPTRAPHRHISIETTMSPNGANPGELFTRMEWPYDQDICEVQVHSSRLTLNGNYMRISGENGSNKELRFCRSFSKESNLDANGNPIYDQVYVPRWGIRSDSTANTTGNVGDDFRLVRYNDAGSALDTSLFVKRSNGYVGIGNTDPARPLDVNGDRMRLRTAFTPASSTAPGEAGTIAWDANYIYLCVTTNNWKRAALAAW